MATTPKPPSTANLVEIIELARNAEICRNVAELQDLLHPLINTNDRLTSFDTFDKTYRAELLRLYGFFLTFEGRAKSRKDFHLLAKDCVTKAIEIFEEEKISEKAAEAKITLAFCYWNNGEADEAEALFEMLENEFENKIDPTYLQLQINKIMLYWCSGRFEKGIEIIKKIALIVELCVDFRLRIMFNLESATLFHHHGDLKSAESYFSKTIDLCKRFDHDYFLAVAYNNYSLVLSDQNNFNEAHDYSIRAEAGFKRINQTGWLPHVYDSQAQIFLAEKQFGRALERVETALVDFSASDDTYGHIGALWTKCRILLQTHKLAEAFQTFGELQIIALQLVGRKTFDFYSELMSREVYPLQNSSYEKEIPEFKKFLVTRALTKADGKKTEAARLLGFEKHQNLSEILNKQFPGLYEELGYVERKKRSDKSIFINPTKFRLEKKADAVISRLDLGDRMLSFFWKIEEYETFYFDVNAMRHFNFDEGAVVVVVPDQTIEKGRAVVALDGDRFVFGEIKHDSFADVYFLEFNGETVFLTEENIYGYPVGYQSMASAKAEIIEFIKI